MTQRDSNGFENGAMKIGERFGPSHLVVAITIFSRFIQNSKLSFAILPLCVGPIPHIVIRVCFEVMKGTD